MTLSLDELAQRLEDGADLAAIVRDGMPAAERELLRRCALARRFDEDVVAALQWDAASESRLPVAAIAGSSLVERLPGGAYRVREGAGVAPLADDGDPMPREIERHLADHWHTRDELEWLYHRFAVEPEAATESFSELFDAAVARYDLARCQDLLDVFSARREAAGPQLAEVHHARRRYLETRRLWADEAYRSSRFLLPDDSRAAFEQLLAPGDARVLRLHARGGMGKTMHVRWLIAERCVKGGIPVARVDFDRIEPLTATREPWRLLLAFAVQLDVQLRGKPFQELLRELGPHIHQLARGAGTTTQDAPDASVDRDVRSRVQSVLAAVAGPVVLILDTLEVAMTGSDAATETDRLGPLVELLAWLHDAVPISRLVLAGRYDLAQQVSEPPASLDGGLSLALREFAEHESRAYLSERRRVADPELIDAAVEKAGGVPFKLALIGDVIDQRPDLTAAEIRGYADADVLYLIERVVERIDNPQLHWLLRYGVVPRRLRRDFVEHVMLPYLPSAMAGSTDADDTRRDALPGRHSAPEPFPICSDPIDVPALWAELKRHAGPFSWVSMPSGEDGLLFHPDVLTPMRRLLSRQPVFAMLHSDAAAYAEERAEAEPDEWAAWMREALYHRLQLDRAGVAGFWRRALARARAVGGPGLRRALADELLSDPPSAALQIEGRYERAVATVEAAIDAAALAHDPAWAQAEADIAAVERLQRGWEEPLISPARLGLVRGPLALRAGRDAEAVEEIQAALHAPTTDEERIRLLIDAAEARRRRGDPEAAEELRAALDTARAGSAPDALVARLRELLATELVAQGRVALALEECEKARAELPNEGPIALEGTVALRAGRFSLALRDSGLPELASGAAAALRADALLAAWRPEEAMAAADAALALARARAGRENDTALITEAHRRRGKVLARMLDASGALKAFELARNLAGELDSGEGVCAAALSAARVQLRTLGAVRDAGMTLDQAERAEPDPEGEAALQVRLLRAEWLARIGHHGEALRLVDAALSHVGPGPWSRIDAALTALAIDGRSHLDTLCAALRQIDAWQGRIVALHRLRACPRISGPRHLVDELWRQAKVDAEDPEDVAVLLATAAEAARVTGRPGEALELLRMARRALLDGPEGWFAFHQLLAAGDRADAGPIWDAPEEEARVWELARGLRSPPLLAADVLYRHGRHLLAGENHAGSAAAMREALDRVQSAGVPTMAEARLHESLAALAEARDSGESAADHRAQAAVLYEQLGDQRRLISIGGLSAAAPPRPTDAPRCVLRLEGHAIVAARIPATHRSAVVRVAAERVLGPLGASASRAWYSSVGRELLGARALAALGELLAGGPTPDASGDLRVAIEDQRLAPLPWELAVDDAGARLVGRQVRGIVRLGTGPHPDELVRSMQAVLGLQVDGIFGPHTARAVAALQRSAGLPDNGRLDASTVLAARQAKPLEASTLVVHASADTADGRARGWMARGVHLGELYGAWSDVVTVEDPTSKRLERAFAERPPSIAHLNAPFFATRAGIALDFASEAISAGRTREELEPLALEAVTLDRLLRQAARGRARPIVILDPPSTPSHGEAMRQLLMRNAFATELFTLGGGAVIGATAGSHAAVRLALLTGLTEALGDGLTVAEAADRARTSAGEVDATEPFHAGVAVFAGNPDLRLLSS